MVTKMNELSFKVLDWDIPINILGFDSKVLLCQQQGKDILIIQEECSTVILEFVSKNYMLSPPNISMIQSKDNVINIFNVSEVIYMLDQSGDLFELVHEKSEWSWKWVQHLDGGLAITGLQSGMAFLRQIEKMTFVEIYNLNMTEFELQSSKKLNYCDIMSVPYQIFNAKGESVKFFLKAAFKKINVKEVIFIGDPSGFTYLLPVNKKLLPLNFEKEFLITTLVNELQNFILLVYASGKIVSIICNPNVKTDVLYLPGKVNTITWFDNDKSSLLWSDGVDLHLSKITNFTEAINLDLNRNIKGIQHLIKFNERILAVTRDGGFYSIKKSDDVLMNPPIIKKSSQVLKEIYDFGVIVEKLNEEIKTHEDLIYAVSISKIENIGKNFEVSFKGRELTIKNKTGRSFIKNLWVFRLQVCDNNKRLVEINNLENDLNEGSLIKVKTKLELKKSLNISLICDCGNDLGLIEIHLPEIKTEEEKTDFFSTAQKLNEIAQKRKKI